MNFDCLGGTSNENPIATVGTNQQCLSGFSATLLNVSTILYMVSVIFAGSSLF